MIDFLLEGNMTFSAASRTNMTPLVSPNNGRDGQWPMAFFRGLKHFLSGALRLGDILSTW